MVDKPTVCSIVKEWLQAHGYDGLCGLHCGCHVDDLMCCDRQCPDCVPAYLHHCDSSCEECGGEGRWGGCFKPEKPESQGGQPCVETGPNYVTLHGRSRGADRRERRYVTFTIDKPGYCVCTGNVPFDVEPGDIQELLVELGALIGRAEEGQ